MKKSKLLLVCFVALFISYMNQSCTEPNVSPSEFIADSTTFEGYSSWQKFTETGINTTLGSMAHGGQDSSTIRDIYYKDSQDPESGMYPVGTVIYKNVTSPAGLDAHFAMVKRGNDFNPANNDWESADVVNSKAITSSTTVAVTEENGQYIINQDFSNSAKETWTIERIEF